MSKPHEPIKDSASPVLGFNNNVRHRGQLFHIQTEDSGVKHPHIITHLFADGGRIVQTTRTDYAEHIGRSDLVEAVRTLMKEQHKAMFIALRDGSLDAVIDGSLKPSVQRGSRATTLSSTPLPVAESSRAAAAPVEAADAPKRRPSARPSMATPIFGTLVYDVAMGAFGVGGTSAGPAQAGASAVGHYAPSRPAPIFGAQGESAGQRGGESSLDEVILNYLSQDFAASDDASASRK